VRSEIQLARESLRTAETLLVLSKHDHARRAHDAAERAYEKAKRYTNEISASTPPVNLDRVTIDLNHLHAAIERLRYDCRTPVT